MVRDGQRTTTSLTRGTVKAEGRIHDLVARPRLTPTRRLHMDQQDQGCRRVEGERYSGI
jgi:hypothetical protein